MKSHSSCRRSKRIVEDASLKEWHQTYHLYRVAVNCFIGAVESYKNVAFHVNDKVLKKNLIGEFKGLFWTTVVKLLFTFVAADTNT